jgi:hypothetical protein
VDAHDIFISLPASLTAKSHCRFPVSSFSRRRTADRLEAVRCGLCRFDCKYIDVAPQGGEMCALSFGVAAVGGQGANSASGAFRSEVSLRVRPRRADPPGHGWARCRRRCC